MHDPSGLFFLQALREKSPQRQLVFSARWIVEEHDRLGAFWTGALLKSLEVAAVNEGPSCAGNAGKKNTGLNTTIHVETVKELSLRSIRSDGRYFRDLLTTVNDIVTFGNLTVNATGYLKVLGSNYTAAQDLSNAEEEDDILKETFSYLLQF